LTNDGLLIGDKLRVNGLSKLSAFRAGLKTAETGFIVNSALSSQGMSKMLERDCVFPHLALFGIIRASFLNTTFASGARGKFLSE
jgi:hypothetical protein